MDNLTHSLVGVLLRRTGLGANAPRPMLVCVLAANAPDFDLLAGVQAPEYLIWHRHITHALAAIPAMALVAVAVAWAIDWGIARVRAKQRTRWNWKAAWLAALLPTASHPLLDAMNSYAVRPWLPFSAAWESFHTLFVLDAVVWGVLLVAWLWPALSNLIAGEIGARASAGRRAAWAGLAALTIYVGWKDLSHGRVVRALEARVWDGAPAKRVGAFPAPFDPRAWMAYVETEAYRMALPVRVDRLDEIDRTAGTKFFPPADADVVRKAWETPMGMAYRQFSLYPLEIVEPQADGVRVILSDARFLRFGKPSFAAVIDLDRAGNVVEAKFGF